MKIRESHLFQNSAGGDWCLYEYRDGAVCAMAVGAHPSAPTPTPLEPGTAEAAIAFVAHADAVLALVRKKDAAYGGAWQKQGYMGNLARILSKTDRLKNMLWADGVDVAFNETGMDEAVMDTLHDLMALAAFMASNIEEGNRWGRQ